MLFDLASFSERASAGVGVVESDFGPVQRDLLVAVVEMDEDLAGGRPRRLV